MAKDPAFLFYASDFLTGTMFFTNEQVGKYIRLLCSQHQHGGFIEKNSFESLVGEDKILKSKFIETEHGFYNVRLSEEMENRNKKSENISEAAKETWKKRRELVQKNTTVLRSYKKRKGIVMQTDNEDEIEDKDIIKKEKELIFPFDSTEFKEAWTILSKEKKWKNKSHSALQAALKILSKYSQHEAIQMIEAAIAGEWQGIHELKKSNNGITKSNSATQEPKIGRIPISEMERFIKSGSSTKTD